MHKQRAHLTGMPQSPGKHSLPLETDNVQEATRLYPRLTPPQTAMRVVPYSDLYAILQLSQLQALHPLCHTHIHTSPASVTRILSYSPH